ncbi:MAG: carbamoyltransferase HypF [Pseudomonadota bacterium]
MNVHLAVDTGSDGAVEIRVRGRVQGVGFRPTVWRIARDLGLSGEVLNDSMGVVVRIAGSNRDVERFIEAMKADAPPLSRIDAIESQPFTGRVPAEFRIADSVAGTAHTQITPDAAVCDHCAREVLDPFERRYRYAFTNCTHCGPRFSIVTGIPYDRSQTTMDPFVLCSDCRGEYEDPSDRRFHAEPIACHACGPKPRLIRFDGRAISFDQHSMLDDVDAVCSLLQKGEIVAIKGLGGYQLACDATNADAVMRLRKRKHRDAKPFALMARDLEIIESYCAVDDEARRVLQSPEAPIVLLPASGDKTLPDAIAPGLRTLGFMLPTTPLHLLILRRMSRPVVMTSGNLSDEPQVTHDEEAIAKLASIADYGLVHNRAIANRIDDSVVQIMGGQTRIMRRARGYAPSPISLPPGFESTPELLALGGELKATFCLVKDGQAILSQHLGDLEDAPTYADYHKNLGLYAELFDHEPAGLIVDRHSEYLSTKLGHELALSKALPVAEVQHHHAHLAACLAENAYPLGASPVLGIVLDGLGLGDDGTIWGGEFLLGSYGAYERLGTFKPVSMPGGASAVREPWRNLYAHVMAEMGWAHFEMNFRELDIYSVLVEKPRGTLDAMIAGGVNSPLGSSCGRLFDAVAAALGLASDVQAYEGDAATRLEAIVDEDALLHEDESLAYPLNIPNLGRSGLPYIEPLAMWNAILGDLILKTPTSVIAARFHKGLAKAIAAMVRKLSQRDRLEGPRFTTVALSGGCFQNRILFEQVVGRLEENDFKVLTHAQVPANDGGLALGQAAIGAALFKRTHETPKEGNA